MKHWYKTAGVFMMIACAAEQANGQGTQFGVGAGTQGLFHTFFGNDAGKVNENSGARNTFIGFEAGLKNSKGSNNTFVGADAGTSNTLGVANTFNGSSAGLSNSTGSNNTFVGQAAGFSNLSGSQNTFLGASAGQNNAQGEKNSFVGYQVGGFNKTGNGNTFFGWRSGYLNESGSENAFLGNNAGFNNLTGTSNTFVGSNSGYSADAGTANAFLGTKSGYSNSNGNNNAFFGYGAGYDNTNGEKNTYLGYAAGGTATLINATAIGAQAKVTADNSLVLGNQVNVGIGMSAPAYQLQLSTSYAAKLGSPSWTIWSDKRLKKDISDFTDGLDLLKQIKPIWFTYNGVAGTKSDKRFVGIIAQEMQKIAPYTIGSSIYQDSLGNKTEYLDYDANAVTYILINSVKEQQEIIDSKDVEIKELSQRLDKLERMFAAGNTSSAPPSYLLQNGDQPDREATLEQNVPNGFSESTSIKYFIPKSVKAAAIEIYTVNGVKVNTYPIEERGTGVLNLSSKEFKSGMHLYDLVTDGKSAGARKMLVK